MGAGMDGRSERSAAAQTPASALTSVIRLLEDINHYDACKRSGKPLTVRVIGRAQSEESLSTTGIRAVFHCPSAGGEHVFRNRFARALEQVIGLPANDIKLGTKRDQASASAPGGGGAAGNAFLYSPRRCFLGFKCHHLYRGPYKQINATSI